MIVGFARFNRDRTREVLGRAVAVCWRWRRLAADGSQRFEAASVCVDLHLVALVWLGYQPEDPTNVQRPVQGLLSMELLFWLFPAGRNSNSIGIRQHRTSDDSHLPPVIRAS